jgi:hypothetical protein
VLRVGESESPLWNSVPRLKQELDMRSRNPGARRILKGTSTSENEPSRRSGGPRRRRLRGLSVGCSSISAGLTPMDLAIAFRRADTAAPDGFRSPGLFVWTIIDPVMNAPCGFGVVVGTAAVEGGRSGGGAEVMHGVVVLVARTHEATDVPTEKACVRGLSKKMAAVPRLQA